ncbi:hypothetical protein, partial [Klebsiella pneumoniae]|uniref:hypothetical protein n=1 Tax=Klebsiella pneumoniae TaxID=573 RepID=UPI0021089914
GQHSPSTGFRPLFFSYFGSVGMSIADLRVPVRAPPVDAEVTDTADDQYDQANANLLLIHPG